MHIYCDESGGVGRGVMTLAGVAIAPDTADNLLRRFRDITGLHRELKGSRIHLEERARFFELFDQSAATATISVAISAMRVPNKTDRGDHDQLVYAALLDDVIGAMTATMGCTVVIIDDGRYDPATLAAIRGDIAALVGPCGSAQLEHSHRLAGLQIADVIANTFFNRAFVTERQAHMAEMVAPFLDDGRMTMRILPRADM